MDRRNRTWESALAAWRAAWLKSTGDEKAKAARMVDYWTAKIKRRNDR